jgi:hypothetical protein
MKYGSAIPALAAGVCLASVSWIWWNGRATPSIAQTAGVGGGTMPAPAPPPIQPPPAQLAPGTDPRIVELENVLGRKAVFTEPDAARLTELYTCDDLPIRRWALVVAGDRLNHAAMPENVRGQVEGVIVDAMSHTEWRLRLTSIACIDGSAFAQRADIVHKLKAMTADPQPEVALRAKRALKQDP